MADIEQRALPPLPPVDGYGTRQQGHYSAESMRAYAREAIAAALASPSRGAGALPEDVRRDAARLDWLERTFSGVTNRERYLPVQMIWGKGCNGRSLREAIDKHMVAASAPEVR